MVAAPLVVGMLYTAGGAAHRDKVQYALGTYLAIVGAVAVTFGEAGVDRTSPPEPALRKPRMWLSLYSLSTAKLPAGGGHQRRSTELTRGYALLRACLDGQMSTTDQEVAGSGPAERTETP